MLKPHTVLVQLPECRYEPLIRHQIPAVRVGAGMHYLLLRATVVGWPEGVDLIEGSIELSHDDQVSWREIGRFRNSWPFFMDDKQPAAFAHYQWGFGHEHDGSDNPLGRRVRFAHDAHWIRGTFETTLPLVTALSLEVAPP